MNKYFYNLPDISQKLFTTDSELLPSVTELFELEMANLEYTILSKQELLSRSAFFMRVEGEYTSHFLLYSNQSKALSQDRSAKTKAYFENGQYSTGYATHGLFPYRGKFHPQLVKGLFNIIGVKPGEIVLDPMCGSGTANIEAALMGINSLAADINPFCQFMTQVKYEALILDKNLLVNLPKKKKQLFKFFNATDVASQLAKIKDPEKLKIYNLALLAFLDAMGYSKRVKTSTHQQLFDKVLDRYVKTVLDFLNNPYFSSEQLGQVKILSNSQALDLDLADNSVDAVVTSPPYSFAIDYAKNDEAQLKHLGHDITRLRNKMIGLVGKNKNQRLDNYFKDMAQVCNEVRRVLKPGKYFVMIIGSNTNQTGGIRLEGAMIDNCEKIGLELVKSILKPIKGMRNTMKDEFILFFRKE